MWQRFLNWIDWDAFLRLDAILDEAIALRNSFNERLRDLHKTIVEDEGRTKTDCGELHRRIDESREIIGLRRARRIILAGDTFGRTIQSAKDFADRIIRQLEAEISAITARRNFIVAIAALVVATVAGLASFFASLVQIVISIWPKGFF